MREFEADPVLSDTAIMMADAMLVKAGRDGEKKEDLALVVFVYNNAVEDIENFINEMINHNPQYTEALSRLKKTMFPGMYMGRDTK